MAEVRYNAFEKLKEIIKQVKGEMLADYRLMANFDNQPWWWETLIDEEIIDMMQYVSYNSFNVAQKCRNLILAFIHKGTKNGIYYACRCFFGEKIIVVPDETFEEEGYALKLFNVDSSLLITPAILEDGVNYKATAVDDGAQLTVAMYDSSQLLTSDIKTFLEQFSTIGNHLISVTISTSEIGSPFFDPALQKNRGLK